MMQTLHGRVTPSTAREYGRTELMIKEKENLFANIEKNKLTVWDEPWR